MPDECNSRKLWVAYKLCLFTQPWLILYGFYQHTSVIWKLLYWLAMWIGWLVSVWFEFVIKGSSYLIYILFILSMLFALLFNVINLMATYCCCWRSCCLLIFFLHFVVRFCFLFIFIHIINFHSFLFILLSVIITLLFTLPVIISTFLLIYFYCFFIIAVII